LRAKAGARPPLAAFESVDDVIKALRRFDKSFTIPKKRSDERDAARHAASALGLRGSAAEGMLEWALDAAPRLASGIRYVINQDQYNKLCKRFTRELLRAWLERRGEKLGFGLASRAVDLVMMALNESESRRCETAAPFLRVPLDARTLAPLRLIIDELTDIDFAMEIPAKPTVGFVAVEEQYYVLEGAISALALRASVAPIVYAYFSAEG